MKELKDKLFNEIIKKIKQGEWKVGEPEDGKCYIKEKTSMFYNIYDNLFEITEEEAEKIKKELRKDIDNQIDEVIRFFESVVGNKKFKRSDDIIFTNGIEINTNILIERKKCNFRFKLDSVKEDKKESYIFGVELELDDNGVIFDKDQVFIFQKWDGSDWHIDTLNPNEMKKMFKNYR